MKRLLVVLMFLAVAACADDPTDDDPSGVGTDFTLSGTVTGGSSGVDLPADIPDPDADTDVDPQTGGDTEEEIDGGTIEIDADEAVDGCGRETDVSVYYTPDTAFEPLDATQAGDFPSSLEGSHVDVNGLSYADQDEGSCVLVAESVSVSEDETGNDDTRGPENTRTPGPRPSGSPSAEATPAKSGEPDEGTAEPDTSP